MAQIMVKVRKDIGDPGIHPRLGALLPGQEVAIEEEEFGAGLFERPAPDFLSPHEKKDKLRAAAEKQRVGDFEPPPEEAASDQTNPANAAPGQPANAAGSAKKKMGGND